MAQHRKELRKARTLSSLAPVLSAPSPLVQDAARELLPRILADEIAFRSELLDSVQRLERELTRALREREYDPAKSSLPALIREHRETVKLSLHILDSAKGVTVPGDAKSTQVSGLIAREGLLRSELQRRGIMDEHGRLRVQRREVVDVESSPASESEGGGVS